MRRRHLIVAATAAAATAPTVLAQEKVVRVVVPFATGGSGDLIPRLLAPALGELLDQPVIVENRPGAGGSVGSLAVAKAAPDGLTLGVASISTLGIHPAVMRRSPYDPVKDFAPISNLARMPIVLSTHPSVPAKDIRELVQLARSPRSTLDYGTPGVGSLGHMLGELFKQATGGFMVHIPYRSAGSALQDVLGGQVQVLFDNLPTSLPHIKAKRPRPMAVAWPSRLPAMPETPTFKEAELPLLNGSSWFGLVAPAQTPSPVVLRLQRAVSTALDRPAIRTRIEELGALPVGNTSEAFATEIINELRKWEAVAKARNISLVSE